ncbi:MAG: hypothetical protein A2840_00145 [Candidatus Buchananbacteria bacterium RIFCSPHIGHO2_01_FULL_47_11b]|uniref:PDZ domain-containing protein n=1 Tax=Candidatus Buchananbacteria bacterium RIFCSPHIGHO2_01_FULL_47_11b TaxID=1797537 RepID=A0A1G1Y5T7_9BACT|nr:MAG: hypothetical protein A2840_00145 [Candidatus Buchananbacteria bacterium RIFCSPHIGHO2_01_FULL_47_11b]
MPKQIRRLFLVAVTGISAVVIIFILGVSFGRQYESAVRTQGGEVTNKDALPEYLTKDINFDLFWQVWQYVQDKYVESDIPETQLFYGALRGLVASLEDPYSVFLEPELSKEFEQELSGNFEGIGAEIGIKNDQLTLIAPLPNTPADQAGLQAGDKILAIDGEGTAGIALDYAVRQIRGQKGSQVILTILREGSDESRDVPIIRDTIEIDSVRFIRKDPQGQQPEAENFLIDGDIAYIELLYFNENTLADWNKTVQKVLEANPRGIIFDLRNNPGGFLSTAIEIAGEWVNGKTVVLERLQSGAQVEHSAARRARFDSIPTVVLVNGGSASGSEIVAGALQDYGAATIVGETTFGKGSVQDLREFIDGSSVKLTIAEWLTPNGRTINKEGITPDIEVELTEENYSNGVDPQLEKAIELLK